MSWAQLLTADCIAFQSGIRLGVQSVQCNVRYNMHYTMRVAWFEQQSGEEDVDRGLTRKDTASPDLDTITTLPKQDPTVALLVCSTCNHLLFPGL